MSPSSFTAKIDIQLSEKLLSDLPMQGFELTRPPYTIFSAKKKGVTCILYESGSLVVQGKDMKEFIEFYLEPEILKAFHFTHPDANLDMTPRIGMDEAGKGDFFGPLCVAAAYADEKLISELQKLGVKDSKRLSDETIRKLGKELRNRMPHVIIRLFPKKYNELYLRFKNLNQLLCWAHITALKDLSETTQCKKAILDQFANAALVDNALKAKHLDIDLKQRTHGEEDIVVAAASILARDAFINAIDQLSHEYGMIIPKGAASIVIDTGVQLVEKFGPDVLQNAAKCHFKTKDEILSKISCEPE